MKLEQLSVIRQTSDWRVWRARDKMTTDRFTVKQAVSNDPASVSYLGDQLDAEWEFLCAQDHAGILRPVRREGRGMAVFEDMQGSLAQLLQQEGKLDADLVVNVLVQCCEALDHLHGKRLGHGSINTRTVLLAPDGRVKFGDFTGYRLDLDAPLPTPDEHLPYQAPELLDQSLGQNSPTSDLYCLGYLALQLLTGQEFERLFAVDTQVGADGEYNWLAWHANLGRRLPHLGERVQTQQALLDLISQMVEKEPAKRKAIRSAAALAQTLRAQGLMSPRALPPLRLVEPERVGVQARRPTGLTAGPMTLSWGPATQRRKKELMPGRPVVVGARGECDMCIPHKSLSRRHALLESHAGRWWVYDLKSREGTFLNGERMRGRERVRDGDELRFGLVKCRVVVKPGIQAQRIPHVRGGSLDELIHSGANGDLYRGRMRINGQLRRAAVRFFPRKFTFDRDQLKRFLRGVSEAAKFRHENIVRLYRAVRVGGKRWYLVMEYLSGGSLRDRLANGKPLSGAEVLRLGKDILTALEAIETEQIVHRNITPSTLLFDGAGMAKLSDFILMRPEELETVHQVTRAGSVPGEKVYQPPEMLFPGNGVRPACDLYSLSACLYEAATGRRIFPAEVKNLPDIISAVAHKLPESPRKYVPEIPLAMEALLFRGLAKRAEERFSFAAQMREELERITPWERKPQP